jgi:ATP-dependent protease ClpP protease subunit
MAPRVVELNNRVYLFGEVNPKTAKKFVKQLHHILETSDGSIGIFVDNFGGYCTNGFTIYNSISAIKDRAVHVIVLGSAQSAALPAILAVPLEHRWCHEDSTFMGHRVRISKISGTDAYLGKHVMQMAFYTNRFCKIIAKQTNMTCEEAKAKFFNDDNENVFFAKEAKKLGFVHRIITDYSKVFCWRDEEEDKPTKHRQGGLADSSAVDSPYVNERKSKIK